MSFVQRIVLSEEEREQIKGMLRKGKRTPRQITRAQILRLADMQKDLTNKQIAERIVCSRETVRRVRGRFLVNGLEKALTEDDRPGQPRKLGPQDETFLASLLAKEKPIGFSSWTLPLLQKRLYQKTSIRVSRETIRRLLVRKNDGE